ncbi:MAG: HEAT repeat domain-containing protein [Candidatus Kariarchaeaceae archaeon]
MKASNIDRVKVLIDGLLNESDLNKRRYYPDKLAKIGNWISTTPLVQVLLDQSEPTLLRIECAESLGKQGNPQAIRPLSKVLHDESSELRRTTIWSLGQIGTSKTLDIVFSLKNDPSEKVVRWVAKSLGRIRNPKCLESLESLFVEYQSNANYKLINEILRAVTTQIKQFNPNISKFWVELSYKILGDPYPIITKKSALELLICCFDHGKLPNKVFIEKYYHTLEPDNILVPGIITALGYCNSTHILRRIKGSTRALFALGIADDIEFLRSILVSEQANDPAILAATLKGLLQTDSKLNPLPYLSHDDLNVRLIAIEMSAKFGLSISILNEGILRGKGVNAIISYYKYYGDEALTEVEKIILNGSKAERQSSVTLLTSNEFLFTFHSYHKISKILEVVSVSDPIWHIRRDARIGLWKISRINK